VEMLYAALLGIAAFWLGACPFSLWVGHWLLGKDIRDYGDGNPGATNVFRAGGYKAASLALSLDVAKGMPFVVLAYLFLGLPDIIVMIVAVSAIVGNAFSPVLGLKGGKSIAVTYGVLLALPQHEMLVLFAVFMTLGFLILGSNSWAVMLGPVGSLPYLVATEAYVVASLFMLCVLVIFGIKQFEELKTGPRITGGLIGAFQSRRRQV
jgi:glycerol-3-phosphate acyltransferase PlsY